jgi:hypothetical protein
MKRARIINGLLAVIFLALTLYAYRPMSSTHDAATDVSAKGIPVFDPREVNAAAKNTKYIMTCLFGALTLVFGWRTLRPPAQKADQPENQ